MTWLSFLSYASSVVQITANVIVIFYVFPAYQRTRNGAFLMIGAACVIGIFDTICDRTIGQYRMAQGDYLIYHTLRRFSYFGVMILETIGTVRLAQSYLRFFPPTMPAAQPVGVPPP